MQPPSRRSKARVYFGLNSPLRHSKIPARVFFVLCRTRRSLRQSSARGGRGGGSSQSSSAGTRGCVTLSARTWTKTDTKCHRWRGAASRLPTRARRLENCFRWRDCSGQRCAATTSAGATLHPTTPGSVAVASASVRRSGLDFDAASRRTFETDSNEGDCDVPGRPAHNGSSSS